MSELNINTQDIRQELIAYKKKCDEQITAKEDAKKLWGLIVDELRKTIKQDYDLMGMESLIIAVGPCGEISTEGKKKVYQGVIIDILKESIMGGAKPFVKAKNWTDIDPFKIKSKVQPVTEIEAASIPILSEALQNEEGYEIVTETLKMILPVESTKMVLAFRVYLNKAGKWDITH